MKEKVYKFETLQLHAGQEEPDLSLIHILQIKDFVDALDRGSADSIYDINQDGTVDLADLQRLYDERREYKQQTSAIERRVPKSAVGVSIEAGTQLVSGKLEDVLAAESAVTLKHADGQAISTDPGSYTHLVYKRRMYKLPLVGAFYLGV